MKFELKPYHRDVDDQDLLDDLAKVASELGVDYLATLDYNRKGEYSSGTITRRFGSWNNALEKAGLNSKFYKNIPTSELFEDLKKVAADISPIEITQKIYDERGKYSSRTITKQIGWNTALNKLNLKLAHRVDISELELFENLEHVWISLGEQPGRRDLSDHGSKFSERPYLTRFGTWRNALQQFVLFINSEESERIELSETVKKPAESILSNVKDPCNHKTKRDVSARLKVQVLIRDGNTCRLCGIKVVGDNIHFDHIKPWAKCGETVFENIQVLCSICNLAKGDYYPQGDNSYRQQLL